MKYLFLTLLATVVALGGCSVVKVSEAGRRINMIPASDAHNCTRVGAVSTSVLDNILFIPRHKRKIQTELDRLARDEAVLMKANTLVHVSTQGGHGEYIAYNCP